MIKNLFSKMNNTKTKSSSVYGFTRTPNLVLLLSFLILSLLII